MKKIAKILKQALRKSAQNLSEDRRLLTEQTGAQYGLQIVNTMDANNECHTPLLRKCEHDTNGVSGTPQTCRHYEPRCLKDLNGQILQIGDCFSWDGNDKIECIVGFAGLKSNSMKRTACTDDPTHCCDECAVDVLPSPNGNGVSDGMECEGAIWTSDVPGCLDCPNCSNYGGNWTPSPVTVDDGSCLGCTDPSFPNYEPLADIDDGSCIHPVTFDCIDGFCEENMGGTGNHATFSDCLSSPDCDRWECQTTTTQDPDPMEEQIGRGDPGPSEPSNTSSSSTSCVQCPESKFDPTSGWAPECQFFEEGECIENCKIKCQCCTDGQPVSMNTQVPYDPGCSVLDGVNGAFNCEEWTSAGINPSACEGPCDDFGPIAAVCCEACVPYLAGNDSQAATALFAQANPQCMLQGQPLCHCCEDHIWPIDPTLTQTDCHCCNTINGQVYQFPGQYPLNPNFGLPCEQLNNTQVTYNSNIIQPYTNCATTSTPITFCEDLYPDPVAPPTPPSNDGDNNKIGGIDLEKELPQLQEGVQLKGKLLDKLRMANLAGIKKKKK